MNEVTEAVKVRDAGPPDLATIVEFNAGIALETEDLKLDRHRLEAGVAAILEDSSKGRYFVASENGRLVGQIMITTEWSDWRNGDFWWIQSVYVLPEFRSRGVFSKLYRFVESAAHQANARGLRLYVDEHNKRAADIYAKLGMHISQYQMMEVDFVIPRGNKSKC